MGLFSSVLHLQPATQAQALESIDRVLQRAGLRLADKSQVSSSGPQSGERERESSARYLVSPDGCPWLTVIEAQFPPPTGPQLADLGKALSKELGCLALTLVVHDDDLFLYNLDRNGESLDGYNSCPQYFETERLSKPDVEAQRHSAEAFVPLLPDSATLSDLEDLLNQGWWSAHDTDRLDDDGIPLDDDESFVFEGERMTGFGQLLQLHGPTGTYPYASWAESPAIAWGTFVSLTYDSQRK